MTSSQRKRSAESELDDLRERLAFYEQFDELIRQNIATSSALLKEASARFDGDISAERQRYRALLSAILDDVTALQGQSERLARRVSDALEELEANLPAPGETTGLVMSPLTAGPPPETEAAIRESAGATPTANHHSATARESLTTASIAADPPHTRSSEQNVRASTTLLVHGMPRASAALDLKGHIESLPFVISVEPREFAAGLLRLQVDGVRPLTLGDLAGWTMADRIELDRASDSLLEVRLAPA